MNILGFNIGQNYKGILNIGSTINSPLSGTLQAVTDGMGNASPLQLSTTQVAVLGPVQTGTGSLYKPFVVNYSNSTISVTGGEALSVGVTASGASRYSVALRLGAGSDTQTHYIYGGDNSVQGFAVSRQHSSVYAFGTGLYVGGAFPDVAPSARLHVRGDGTNPIARFENPSATDFITINNSAAIRAETTDTNAEILRLQRNNSYFLSYAPVGLFRIQTISGGAPNGVNNTKWIYFSNRIDSSSNASQAGLMIDTTIACATGSHSPRVFEVGYSINNAVSQTGTTTGIFLNATETALNGMAHNLIDLQVGGVSQFSVSRTGLTNSVGGFQSVSGNNRFANLIINGGAILQTTNGGSSAAIELTSTGTRLLNILNLQFGGNTNAFPMLKRNGAALEVRLADDSGYANLNTAQIFGYTAGGSPAVRFKLGEISGGQGISTREGQFAVGFTDASQNSGFRFLAAGSGTTYFDGWSEGTTKALNYRMVFGSRVNNTGVNTTGATTAENGTPCIFGFDSHDASAIVQINSTTRGFLPPRQTEAQRLAISSPAVGLIVYQTDASDGLYVYKTGGWTLII